MYIADLHIHSRFSRATSKSSTPEYLDLWARRKGIHIVGSGDFTHPGWREELREKLEPAEEGLYVLKKEYRIEDDTVADTMCPRFVITGEISSIYKKNGKVRKVHSLILLPGLEAAEVISCKLESIGNIRSDGRPILGLDCRDLLEILLELCPESVYGLRIFLSLGHFPGLIPWKNAMKICPLIFMPWRPGSLPILL